MKHDSYSRTQLCALILLRLSIGWHFLYEGVSKLFVDHWSAAGYLLDSQGLFSPFFTKLVTIEPLLEWINIINITLLCCVGLSLICGFVSKWGAWIGTFLLCLYYLSHIPFIGAVYQMPSEGSYLWVDKNLIEMFALIVLALFPTSQIIGIDRVFQKMKQSRNNEKYAEK